MTAELARVTAAQAKADDIVRTVGEMPDGPLLRVAVTDPVTNLRLATCFVKYRPGTSVLRLVDDGEQS